MFELKIIDGAYSIVEDGVAIESGIPFDANPDPIVKVRALNRGETIPNVSLPQENPVEAVKTEDKPIVRQPIFKKAKKNG